MDRRTVAVAHPVPGGGSMVKLVRVGLLAHYVAAGWHPVPRRRFRKAKRQHERRKRP